MIEKNYSAGIADTENKYSLMLFISGMSPKSIAAIESLREVCDTYLGQNFDLEIVDIYQQSQAAFDHQILATPCLIKFNPLPKRIVLGDLSDKRKLMNALGIEIP